MLWCDILQMWCDDIDGEDMDLIGCEGYCRGCCDCSEVE